MKCVNCNSELKEGAKFCTSCGTKVTEAAKQNSGGEICPQCSAPLKANAKFCTSCGFKLAANQEQPTSQTTNQQPEAKGDIETIKQYIFWNVENGEIARKINEAEFIKYDSARGVIINDGTTAFIKVNGQIINRLSGGNYNFVEPDEINKIMESRTGGVLPEMAKKGFKFFWNTLWGTKVKDRIIDPTKDPKKQRTIDSLVACMRQNDPLMSITLMLDRDFELLFGAPQQSVDDYSNFKPMKIRTKVLDIDFGVRAKFRIDNSELFSKNYLSDKSMVSAAMLTDILTPVMKAAIQRIMSDVEVENYRLSAEVSKKLEQSIVEALAKNSYGVSLVNIVSVSMTNEDLERMRVISRELYLSEKELDFLSRSNDLKNRMNLEMDAQEILEAQREGEKARKLVEINKDNLLSAAEYNKFVDQLNFDAQKRAIELNLQLFNQQHNSNLRQTAAQHEIDVMEGRNENELVDIKLDKNRKIDDYNFDKANKELEFQDKKADSAIDRLRKMKQIKREEEQDAHRRAQEVENAKREHERELLREKNQKELSELEQFANMSSEQVMSVGAMRNMDAEGSKAYAEAMGKKFESENKDKIIENLEQMNRERNEDRDRDNDRLERMMMQMMGAQQSQISEQNRKEDRMKQEYEAKLERQERRVDATSETALEYTTRNNSFASAKSTIICPQCGAPQEGEAPFCDECGSRIN